MAKKQPPTRFRCDTCGKELSRDRFGNGPVCRDHPQGEPIEKTGRQLWAEEYLCRQPEGTDLAAFVEEYDDDYYPGVTRADLALALMRLSRWGMIDRLRAQYGGPNLLFS